MANRVYNKVEAGEMCDKDRQDCLGVKATWKVIARDHSPLL